MPTPAPSENITPDALAAKPPKISWKRWAVALASVLAIIAVTFLLKAPAPERVKIWFVCSTNFNGLKALVFQGTNGAAERIMYAAVITTNMTTSSRADAFADVYITSREGRALAGESFTFQLAVPPKEPAWRVVWTSVQTPPEDTLWMKFRMLCRSFFRSHGMPGLAERFDPRVHWHSIPATELKE